MAKERINLENLINTRDLGGYITMDGKRIKDKKLIRSAALYSASENDIKTLKDEYHLEVICDFRGKNELDREPDPTIENVEHKWLPIFEEQEQKGSITREEQWDTSDPLAMYIYFMNMFKGKEASGEENGAFYKEFVLNEHSINEYKKFFDVLLEERDGSVLWHCSAGKDRCGTGTIFLLKALGMSDELIYEDYLLSNVFYQPLNEEMIRLADERGLDKHFHIVIEKVNGVDKAFIDILYKTCEETYGSMDNFLRDKLELNEEKIAKLKALYLE